MDQFIWLMFMIFPLLLPVLIGGIIAQSRKSWTPLFIGVGIGGIAQFFYYTVILSQLVVQ
jgi:hypothetical protein